MTDTDGFEIGTRVLYGTGQPMLANISAASGYAQTEQFGNLDSYDRVIVTDWLDCPIDENTVLFVDKEPAYREVTIPSETPGGTPTVIKEPLYDYVVKRVARSVNNVSIAISKVRVS